MKAVETAPRVVVLFSTGLKAGVNDS